MKCIVRPAHQALGRTLSEGALHLQGNRIGQAITCFERVVKWLPTHAHAHLQLGYLYIHNGNLPLALQHTELALDQQPKNIVIWGQYLLILERLEHTQAVTEAWQEVERLGLPVSQIEQVRRSLIMPPDKRIDGLITVLQEGNMVNTEIAARLFISTYTEHPLGWQVLGEVLHDSRQFDEALEIKRKAAEKFPQDANVFNNLARTLLAIQDYAGTKANAQKALKIDPNHKNAAYHLMKAKTALERTGQKPALV